ncbi:MAG: helix-turn-helix domain-containing protein [Sedimentisphaerales bacterium]|nr:helix-turn-helix domain-containing protein [Sedimentisphaerales bacterium]
MAKGKNILTTGDVAKICNVAPRTVSKWFDSGQLKGYRIPGSKDRRIPINELIRFMKQNNMPLPALSLGSMRVVIADGNGDSGSALADMLNANSDYEVKIVKSTFETAAILHKFSPQVLLINLLSKEIDASELCKNIRADEDLRGIRIIALANNRLTTSETAALLQKGFDGFVSKPGDVSEVIGKIEEATSSSS